MDKLTTGLLVSALLAGACTASIGETGRSGSGGSGGSPSGPAGSGGAKSGTGGNSGGGTGGVAQTGGSGPIACTPGVAPTSQVRRLTNIQYERVIRDLLGVTTLKAAGNVTPSILLATDQDGGLTDLAWSTYQSIADMVATQVLTDASLKKKFMECTPSGDGKACLHDTIVKFGRKAFRRPLTNDEIAAFDNIVANGASISASASADDIGQTVLYMFLISPTFLQRAETGTASDGAGHFQLTSHEVAARLSFMLWGTVPDDALNQAADKDELKSSSQILAQAQRMLKDDRARDAVAAFHRTYLLMAGNTRWDNANHDSKLFPAFNKDLVPALEGEMEKFFDDTVFKKNGTFQDLLTSNVGFVTAKTAPIYGLDPAKFGPDYTETKLDANQRPGFLTRAGFLGAYSSYSRTSPILRGAFITKQILGVAVGSPPPGAEATMLPASPELDTNRKQVDAQTTGQPCESCHRPFINPPGFVMEAYDSIGQWQTKEASGGAAIDTTADVTIDGVPVRVTSPSELMKKIAASPGAQRRYAEKWVGYAFERDGDARDCGTINDLAGKITAGGYTITNLISDLTQAPQFRARAADGVTP